MRLGDPNKWPLYKPVPCGWGCRIGVAIGGTLLAAAILYGLPWAIAETVEHFTP